MNGRFGRSLAALVFAAFLIATLVDIARAAPAPEPAQAFLAGSALSIRGDLSGAGMPGATLGTLMWGDYDHDGDQDFLLVVREGSTSRSRLYRNDGSNECTGVATCTTVGTVTTCEGDASDGLSFIKTSAIELWVQNLTTDITPW